LDVSIRLVSSLTAGGGFSTGGGLNGQVSFSTGGGASLTGGGSGSSNSMGCWQNGHSNVFAMSSSVMRTASLQDGQLISINFGLLRSKSSHPRFSSKLKTSRFFGVAGFRLLN
jgi:hypothetical protein